MEDRTMKIRKLRKDDEKGVSPVIAVILMVAITVVLASVLYASIGQVDPRINRNSSMSAITTEKTTYWLVEIVSVSGGTINIEDTKFQIIDTSNTVFYGVDISESNPSSITRGKSTIYPIASGTTPVIDNSTSNIVTGNSDLNDYENCYVAIVDQNSDNKINAGDNIWIYKDYNSDGINDIKINYKFEILAGSAHLLAETL